MPDSTVIFRFVTEGKDRAIRDAREVQAAMEAAGGVQTRGQRAEARGAVGPAAGELVNAQGLPFSPLSRDEGRHRPGQESPAGGNLERGVARLASAMDRLSGQLAEARRTAPPPGGARDEFGASAGGGAAQGRVVAGATTPGAARPLTEQAPDALLDSIKQQVVREARREPTVQEPAERLPAQPPPAPAAKPAGFSLTREWQDVPEGTILPGGGGLEVKMNMTTGRNQARVNPPGGAPLPSPAQTGPTTPPAAAQREPVTQPITERATAAAAQPRQRVEAAVPEVDVDTSPLVRSIEALAEKLVAPLQAAVNKAAAQIAGGGSATPGSTVRIPLSDITTRPEETQFRRERGGQRRVTNRLASVENFDPNEARAIDVMPDPENKGKFLVFEGNNRVALANRQLVKPEFMEARVFPFETTEQGRRAGALTNISGGQTTPFDVASFLRETGDPGGKQMLASGKVGRDVQNVPEGIALSNLADPIFQQFERGQLSEARAVSLGRAIPDREQQERAFRSIREIESKRGRAFSPEEFDIATRRAATAGAVQAATGPQMPGFENVARSTFAERIEIEAGVESRLRQTERLGGTFGSEATVAAGREAGILTGKVDVGQAQELRRTAGQTRQTFRALADQPRSAVDELLSQGAAQLAAGGAAKDIIGNIVKQVTDPAFIKQATRTAFGGAGVTLPEPGAAEPPQGIGTEARPARRPGARRRVPTQEEIVGESFGDLTPEEMQEQIRAKKERDAAERAAVGGGGGRRPPTPRSAAGAPQDDDERRGEREANAREIAGSAAVRRQMEQAGLGTIIEARRREFPELFGGGAGAGGGGLPPSAINFEGTGEDTPIDRQRARELPRLNQRLQQQSERARNRIAELTLASGERVGQRELAVRAGLGAIERTDLPTFTQRRRIRTGITAARAIGDEESGDILEGFIAAPRDLQRQRTAGRREVRQQEVEQRRLERAAAQLDRQASTGALRVAEQQERAREEERTLGIDPQGIKQRAPRIDVLTQQAGILRRQFRGLVKDPNADVDVLAALQTRLQTTEEQLQQTRAFGKMGFGVPQGGFAGALQQASFKAFPFTIGAFAVQSGAAPLAAANQRFSTAAEQFGPFDPRLAQARTRLLAEESRIGQQGAGARAGLIEAGTTGLRFANAVTGGNLGAVSAVGDIAGGALASGLNVAGLVVALREIGNVAGKATGGLGGMVTALAGVGPALARFAASLTGAGAASGGAAAVSGGGTAVAAGGAGVAAGAAGARAATGARVISALTGEVVAAGGAAAATGGAATGAAATGAVTLGGAAVGVGTALGVATVGLGAKRVAEDTLNQGRQTESGIPFLDVPEAAARAVQGRQFTVAGISFNEQALARPTPPGQLPPRPQPTPPGQPQQPQPQTPVQQAAAAFTRAVPQPPQPPAGALSTQETLTAAAAAATELPGLPGPLKLIGQAFTAFAPQREAIAREVGLAPKLPEDAEARVARLTEEATERVRGVAGSPEAARFDADEEARRAEANLPEPVRAGLQRTATQRQGELAFAQQQRGFRFQEQEEQRSFARVESNQAFERQRFDTQVGRQREDIFTADSRQRRGIETGFQRTNIAIGRNLGRQLEDIDIGAGQQREDIGRNLGRQVRDIRIGATESREDVGRGLQRTERDIDIGAGRSKEEIQRNFQRGAQDIVFGQIGGLGGQFLRLGIQRQRALADLERGTGEAKDDARRRAGDQGEDIGIGTGRAERRARQGAGDAGEDVGIGRGRAEAAAQLGGERAKEDNRQGRTDALADADQAFEDAMRDLAKTTERGSTDMRAVQEREIKQIQEDQAVQRGLRQQAIADAQQALLLTQTYMQSVERLIEAAERHTKSVNNMNKAIERVPESVGRSISRGISLPT